MPDNNPQPVLVQKSRKQVRRSVEEHRSTVIVSFHIPPNLLRAVDELVEKGVFNNRSEAFRTAIVLMLRDFSKLQYTAPQPQVGYR
ncbi:MAG: ribbon-helix-helix domain-containing protein [Thermofilum sp.]|nr:ribbon-helix-helix domain-containing protein [Thermofilum sp.]